MSTAAELPVFPVRKMEGLRASELARCPRMCALRASQVAAEPTALERRYFARGTMYGKFVAEQLAVRYGADNVEFEKAIPWEHGTAHVDIYVKSEHLFVEVLSTTSPSTLTLSMKIQQVKIYMRLAERHVRATTGIDSHYDGQVYVVNPSSLTRDEAFPVTLTDEDREQIDQWITEVGAAVSSKGTSLPLRVCSKPSDGRAHLCPFVEPCFEDWVPPPLTAIDDPEVLEFAARHHQLAEQERVSRRAADHLKGQRKEIEEKLADRVEPGEHEAGGYIVSRSHRSRESLALSKARAANAWTPVHDEVFGPFVSVSEYDVFTVKRQEGAEPPELGTHDDYYGDVPF